MERPNPRWTATYRLQLNRDFTFDDVATIAPYLAELGISHVYFSPILQASAASTHGYDLVDPSRISGELGGLEAYERARQALEHEGIGQIVDIVPNHMATTDANRWWWDVLRNGPESAYARYFDLRWQQPGRDLRPFIRLPFLEDAFERVIEAGKLRLEARDGEMVVCYYSAAFPLAPGTQPPPGTDLQKINAGPAAFASILDAQHYRLVSWQTSGWAVDYRRFFNINGLVGLRVEDRTVFEETHRLILDLVSRRYIDGLRIDHIDGLRRPAAYLEAVRNAAMDTRVLVEKILEVDESLPDWPVDGTTGYEFLNLVNGLFIDEDSEAALSELYRTLTGETRDYGEILTEKKRFVLEVLFDGDLANLAGLFAETFPRRPWLLGDIQAAIREVIVALPVYRTYADPATKTISRRDRSLIEAAVETARARLPHISAEILNAVSALLTLDVEPAESAADCVYAFQQLSGPAMAKGAEDTAFYCYNRLTSLNEVGGNPARFAVTPGEFHRRAQEMAGRFKLTMLTTSTHDTKRGEDVRLRVDAISELPQEWTAFVTDALQQHEAFRRDGWPDRNTLYLLYQTLAGAWPIDEQRIGEYMIKAVREASVISSWRRPNPAYETSLRDYIARLYQEEGFMQVLGAFAARLEEIGRLSSLSETLIKLTSPGAPDLYQGSELWELSLVDPDNRRPVDYEVRRRLLTESLTMDGSQALARLDSGLTKLWLIQRVLRLRREQPDLFDGDYVAVTAGGSRADCAFAFGRGEQLLTVAPRLFGRLRGGWEDTFLNVPIGPWHNTLTESAFDGGRTLLAELLRDFPVALLVRQPVD